MAAAALANWPDRVLAGEWVLLVAAEELLGVFGKVLIGVCFSIAFMILQLIPIPGLEGVHFCTESYLLLIVWLSIGAAFYLKRRK